MKDGAVLNHRDRIHPVTHTAVPFYALDAANKKSAPNVTQNLTFERLRRALGTLLFDLLTSEEEAIDLVTGHLRFDIGLLAERLVGTSAWLGNQPGLRPLGIGYFDASTGGGAALVAAAELGDRVSAVVSRGGRPDLAAAVLPNVMAATLLIVGEYDRPVIAMNQAAYEQLRCMKALGIVPGATHLFEEPGALEEVARLATEWFQRHLR